MSRKFNNLFATPTSQGGGIGGLKGFQSRKTADDVIRDDWKQSPVDRLLRGQNEDQEDDHRHYAMPAGYHRFTLDQLAVETYGSREDRSKTVRVGTDKGYGGGGIDQSTKSGQIMVGVRDTWSSTWLSDTNREVGHSFYHKAYGVNVFSNLDTRYKVIETASRGVETSTYLDPLDRQYGVRTKIRDFDILVQHDFDDLVTDDRFEPATLFYLYNRGLAVSAQGDISDRTLAASIGLGDVITTHHEIDARDRQYIGEAVWHNNWSGEVVLNLPNSSYNEGKGLTTFDNRIYAKVGVGVPGITYAAGGIGISNEGLPELSWNANIGAISVGSDFITDQRYDLIGDQRFIAQQHLGVGKFIYTFEGQVVPNYLPSLGKVVGLLSSVLRKKG